MMHMQRADEIDGDQPLPLLRLGSGERTEDIPAGVVHQYVDGPEPGFHRGDGRVDATSVGDVATERLPIAAIAFDGGGDLLRSLEVQIEHGNLSTFARKAAAG
jgi:hypothetical protein